MVELVWLQCRYKWPHLPSSVLTIKFRPNLTTYQHTVDWSVLYQPELSVFRYIPSSHGFLGTTYRTHHDNKDIQCSTKAIEPSDCIFLMLCLVYNFRVGYFHTMPLNDRSTESQRKPMVVWVHMNIHSTWSGVTCTFLHKPPALCL